MDGTKVQNLYDGHTRKRSNLLHLKLKKNEHLMAPGMKVSRENIDGTVTSHPATENTFYLGNVISDPQSTVAVRNDGGLVSCCLVI